MTLISHHPTKTISMIANDQTRACAGKCSGEMKNKTMTAMPVAGKIAGGIMKPKMSSK